MVENRQGDVGTQVCYTPIMDLIDRRTTCSAVDAGIKIRPSGLEDLRELGSEFDSRWREYFVPAPDKPVAVLALVAGFR